MKQVVLTGHRELADEEFVISVLEKSFSRLKEKGCDTLIQGMALGADILGGYVALKLDMRVIACIPHFGHEFRRSNRDRKIYWGLLAHPNTEVHYVHDGPFYKGSFFKRNQYMINLMGDDDIVLAIMSNENSGTGHCVKYARENNKTIYVFNPENHSWSSENAT